MAVDYADKITKVLTGYLSQANLGVTVKAGYNGDELKRPLIVVKDETTEWPSKNVWSIPFIIALLSTTERSKEADVSIMASIRDALNDRMAFDAYLKILTAEERTGWRIFKVMIRGGETSVGEEGTRDHVMNVAVSGMGI